MTQSDPVAQLAGTDDRATRRRIYAYLDSLGLRRDVNMALMVRRALDRGVTITSETRRKARLSYRGQSAWFTGSRSSVNTSLAVRCADNKEVTSSLLRASGLNAPENLVFEPMDLRRAWAWAEPITPVVVKPASGQEGKLIHVGLDTYEEFQLAFTAVVAAAERVLVERVVTGDDRRVTVVGGRAIAATRRLPAHVVGDGVSTVAELVDEKNAQRRRSGNPVHKKLNLGEVELRHLHSQGVVVDSVPSIEEVVYLRRNANVATGGDAVDATDDLSSGEIEYAERVAAAIPGLRFCGIDLMIDRESGVDPWVVEINSNPLVSPHHYPWHGQPRDVHTPILEAMLPALTQQPRLEPAV